ncbi:hypothetical protein H4Q32_025446 [Labeo rohita]|uniref:Uncharacterized protein n=1 Tax=Labeo rohita TaxID=84645 RepID=A0ABQ8LCR5_LABRO|nr:hypothetical protein H4Q32_025446 [Labeo rohita]
MLFNQRQKRNIDPVYIKAAVQGFTNNLLAIRDSIPFLYRDSASSDQQHKPKKRQRTQGPGEQRRLHTKTYTKDGIYIIIMKKQMVKYQQGKRVKTLKTTVEANPMLKKAKLKTELSLIYENPEFRVGSGAVPLYQFFIDNNLQSAFTDTVSLLKIIITICDNREVLFYFEGDQNYPKN